MVHFFRWLQQKALPRPSLGLRWVLGTLFVGQVVGTVVIVGVYSYQEQQKAIQGLVREWMSEVRKIIDQELNHYLEGAQTFNQFNLNIVQSGILDLEDHDRLGRYFFQQARTFQWDYVNFGGVNGAFIGAGRGVVGGIEIAEVKPNEPDILRYYAVNNQGERQQLLGTQVSTQVLNRSWYLDAVKAGKPIWSEIYTWGDLPDRISISASAPVYDDQRQLLGVLGIDLELSQISRFLQQVARRDGDRIFIIERSGLLVASSNGESPAPIQQGQAQRVSALESRDPVIRQVSQALSQQSGGFARLTPRSDTAFERWELPGLTPLYVWVQNYRDAHGLDWLVISVAPEERFLKTVQESWRKTLFLSGGILLVAIALGLGTAYWITKPIIYLSKASLKFAQGEWQTPLPPATAIREIDQLTIHYQEMAQQLYQSLQDQRRLSEQRFEKMANISPNLLYIYDFTAEGNIYANSAVAAILGYSPEEMKIMGHNLIPTICHPEDLPKVLEAYQRITTLADGEVIDLEYRIIDKWGHIHWLLSRDTVFARSEEGKVIQTLGSAQDITALKKTGESLQISLQEKETLLKEIHHRVKNNLLVVSSLLSWQREGLQDPKLIQVFEDSQRRLNTMALIHEKLYRSANLERVDLEEYITSLAQQLMASSQRGNKPIQLITELTPLLTNIETATPCGLIVNELIANTLEHAFPPFYSGSAYLRICLQKTDANENSLITLIVEDNGVGFPDDFDTRQTESLGWQLIHLLTEQLDGQIKIDTEKTTRIILTFQELSYRQRLSTGTKKEEPGQSQKKCDAESHSQSEINS